MSERPDFTDVLKVGNGALTVKDAEGAVHFNDEAFDYIGTELSQTERTVLVSSVAITAGMMATGTTVRPNPQSEMPELQRLASIGWRDVHNLWAESITGRETGGLLLTRQELGERGTRDEALHVIDTLLHHGDVPVINENDSITHEEITFGSNDILSAELAANMQRSGLFGNVRLFLLTDVNGVLEDIDNPHSRIPVIESPLDYEHLAEDTDDPALKIGGMVSKFDAAHIAAAGGVDMWIYDPTDGHRIQAVGGYIGTHFPA